MPALSGVQSLWHTLTVTTLLPPPSGLKVTFYISNFITSDPDRESHEGYNCDSQVYMWTCHNIKQKAQGPWRSAWSHPRLEQVDLKFMSNSYEATSYVEEMTDFNFDHWRPKYHLLDSEWNKCKLYTNTRGIKVLQICCTGVPHFSSVWSIGHFIELQTTLGHVHRMTPNGIDTTRSNKRTPYLCYQLLSQCPKFHPACSTINRFWDTRLSITGNAPNWFRMTWIFSKLPCIH